MKLHFDRSLLCPRRFLCWRRTDSKWGFNSLKLKVKPGQVFVAKCTFTSLSWLLLLFGSNYEPNIAIIRLKLYSNLLFVEQYLKGATLAGLAWKTFPESFSRSYGVWLSVGGDFINFVALLHKKDELMVHACHASLHAPLLRNTLLYFHHRTEVALIQHLNTGSSIKRDLRVHYHYRGCDCLLMSS